MNFKDIWERIKKETELKTLTKLAELLDIKQPSVSEMKKKEKFPTGWAYIVARKYKLSTEWIMTGEGPKRLVSQKQEHDEYILMLEEWLKELSKEDPRKKYWFQCNIEETFPGFKEWMEQRQGEKRDQKAA